MGGSGGNAPIETLLRDPEQAIRKTLLRAVPA